MISSDAVSALPPPAHALSLSVRDFVAPLVRTGSIDVSLSLHLEDDPLVQGTKAHARIQKRLAREHPGFQKELPIQTEIRLGSFALLVRGKMDGYIPAANGLPPMVEEIKCSFRPRSLARQVETDAHHVYVLQAKMYAWMRWRATGEQPVCRLRLVSLLDETETLIELDFHPERFEEWVQAHANAHVREQEKRLLRAQERSRLADELLFPYTAPRPGQLGIMEQVSESLEKGERLMLQAPTGLGKSAAILFPALRWALRHEARVFYATPRNSQHAVAEEVARRLNAQGFAIRSVTIRAKERVCPTVPMSCRPEGCPRAHRYYDRLAESGAIDELARLGVASPDIVAQLADLHGLCPFELSLDAARGADLIICDYNYVFAPNAQLQRFFGTPEECARNVVLVDEAHNLSSRATDWFSPQISKSWLKELDNERKKAVESQLVRTKLKRRLTACLKALVQHEGPSRVLEPDGEALFKQERELMKLVGALVADGDELPSSHPLIELFRGWSDFCNILRERGEQHVITWNAETTTLQITCADASHYLSQRHRLNANTVAFSATLKPFEYHLRLGGFPLERTRTCEFPSPFPLQNRKIILVPQISTLFRERVAQAPRIAEFLERVLPLRIGNYFVFFPSYDFLEKTLAHVALPDFEIIVQPRNAQPSAIAAILERLRTQRGLAVFAVQGGSLSEGIDCPGEALIGAVVVGPPLPQFNLEREEVRKYFDRKYGLGRSYAYTFPAMARAVQAAGRVIRTPHDRGLIALLDRRFLQDEYAACLPSDWFEESVGELVSRSILSDVSGFWEERGPGE